MIRVTPSSLIRRSLDYSEISQLKSVVIDWFPSSTTKGCDEGCQVHLIFNTDLHSIANCHRSGSICPPCVANPFLLACHSVPALGMTCCSPRLMTQQSCPLLALFHFLSALELNVAHRVQRSARSGPPPLAQCISLTSARKINRSVIVLAKF